ERASRVSGGSRPRDTREILAHPFLPFFLQYRSPVGTFASLALSGSPRFAPPRLFHATGDFMRYATALLAGLMFHTHASAQAVTFVNGNFETGDFTGWTVGLTSSGATA